MNKLEVTGLITGGYLPGVLIESACPSCGKVRYWDGDGGTELPEPMDTTKTQELKFYCADYPGSNCDRVWTETVSFKVTVIIEQREANNV